MLRLARSAGKTTMTWKEFRVATKETGARLNLLRAWTFPGRPGCSFEADGSTYEIGITIRKVEE